MKMKKYLFDERKPVNTRINFLPCHFPGFYHFITLLFLLIERKTGQWLASKPFDSFVKLFPLASFKFLYVILNISYGKTEFSRSGRLYNLRSVCWPDW
jgi:hypothetical protein